MSIFVSLAPGQYSIEQQVYVSGSPTTTYNMAVLTVTGSGSAAPPAVCNPPIYPGPACKASLTAIAPTPSIYGSPPDTGYWLVNSNGSVCTIAPGGWYGDASGVALNKGIISIAGTASGFGYWLLGGDGGIFSYGDAQFYGSTGALRLNAPIVGMAATRDGKGYWFVGSDGGIFAYGDAQFYGSMGGKPLNKPIVGMAADPATGGYWLVASDGGIFAFNAPFFGSTGSIKLAQPIVGMEAATDGSGYRFVAYDGGVFCFNLPFSGSAVGALPPPVVGIAQGPSPQEYVVINTIGYRKAFGGGGAANAYPYDS
jgi:hypothetical protein